jgi:hypothetical protein
MAKPHTSKVRHCFTFDEEHRFHIEGTDFDKATQVHLVDPAATWDPEFVLQKDFKEQTKTSLQFDSTPRKKGDFGAGALTITVTNADGDDTSPPTVDSSYSS